MIAYIFTDGASRGNPGDASYGCWVMVAGRLSWGIGYYIGTATNNVAEYSGVIRGLEFALEALEAYDITSAILFTDSEVVVKQLSGEYACRDAKLIPLYETALAFIANAKKPLSIRHILRESNTKADAMANLAIERRSGVVSRETYDSVEGIPLSQNTSPVTRPIKRRRT